MKKLNLIIVAACAAFSMQACHNNASTGNADSTATTVKTDSGKMTDTSKMASAMPDPADTAFTNKAAAGGATEIAASKMALKMSTNVKINEFATMMISDHSTAGDKLMNIAKAKNIMLPAGPNPMQQSALDELSKKSGSDFNMAYVDQMVKDHKETVAMFENSESTVKDSTLKAFITATLPTLHKHLDAVTALKTSMK